MASIINATTSTGLVQTADNSGSLQLQTNNGTTAVTIDTSQNVGVGTTSPTRKLSINGDIRLGDGGGTGAIFTDATNGLRFMQPASGTSSTESMRITSSGNVLVGTSTNPSSANVRQVLATSGDTYIQFASGSTGGGLVGNTGATMLFYTYTGAVGSESYSERMRIDSSGNVFVGGASQSAATNVVYSKSNAKAWVFFTQSGGSITVENSFNVSSVTRAGGGIYDVNFSTAMSSNAYACVGSCNAGGSGTLGTAPTYGDRQASATPTSTSSCRLISGQTASATCYDAFWNSVIVFGT